MPGIGCQDARDRLPGRLRVLCAHAIPNWLGTPVQDLTLATCVPSSPDVGLRQEDLTAFDRPRGPLGQVAVIIPTYNERENLESITGRVRASVPDADILVVDDNSPDRTG